MNRKNETVRSVVLGTVRRQPLLCTALVLAVAGAVAASLLPPLPKTSSADYRNDTMREQICPPA